jgi:small subunit ribosomal protein S16
MLTIRFARVGKRNKAQFKIMLQEHTIAPGGRHLEVLGSYNPHSKEALLKEDRIKYWISKGAQMSDTAANLFMKKGVIEGKKRKVKVPAKKVEEVVAETPKVEEIVAPAEVIKAEETIAPVVEVKAAEVMAETPLAEQATEETKAE